MASVALQFEDKKEEKKNKALAAIITIVIHGLLLLFLLLYIIITPIPPYPETKTPELVLDFGGGGGSSASSAVAASSTNQAVKAPSSNMPTVNNDVEPSTPIPSAKAKVMPKKIDTVPKPPQPSVELASALNKFKTAKGSSGGNSGTGEPGNGGGGNGSSQGPGNGPGTGTGPGGNGKGWSLNGRQLLVRPKVVTNNPVQGQIVVGITVDQDGNVTEATPGAPGSTITDANLYLLVKNASMKIKFNKSHEDIPEQNGTVTFVFTIQ